MPQRLFQDVAGTIPAVLPGDPVGLSIRAAGDVNATQGVALAKPTLVRWPANGRRNLANGAQAVDDTAYWPSTSIQGVTRTKIGVGVEDGVPYVDIGMVGTLISPEVSLYTSAQSAQGVEAGVPYSARSQIRVISGDMSAPVVGFRTNIAEGTGLGQGYVRGSIGNAVTSTDGGESSVSHVSVGGDSNYIYATIVLRAAIGAVVDIVVRVKGLQFERGTVPTPLQFNYGPNNITEPGVPDKWHLYNDGGDSLSAVLPAGTYGTAHLIADGSYTFGTVVSDGSTPLTTIPNDRQVDCIYRLGAFTAEEQANILAYWQRKFPQ